MVAGRRFDPSTHVTSRARRIGTSDARCENPTDRATIAPVGGRPMNQATDTDHLYDLIIEIDRNTRPRVARRGSAVFIHLARQAYDPTARYALALEPRDLEILLASSTPRRESAFIARS
jgi:L,D-peptidoglycan transpeptidase YkuD (ErfK/YbiS/YcfS/YnhG family)